MLQLFTQKAKLIQDVTLLFLIGLVVRLGVNWIAYGFDIQVFGDEKVFTSIAFNLLRGNGFSMDGLDPSAHRPPLYPVLLSLVFFVFGQSIFVARLFSVLFSALTVCVVYLIARQLFDRRAGLIAGLAAVFNPFFFYKIPILLYSDALYVLLFTSVIFLLIKSQETDSPKIKVLSGVVLGLAILTRSEPLLFTPVIVLWAFFYHSSLKSGLRTAGLILLPALLIISPWLLRNYMTFNKPVVATNFGCVLWGVYNPITFSDPNFMGTWEFPESPCLIIGRPTETTMVDFPGCEVLPETEWDSACARLALTSLKENYKQLPRMMAYKLRNLVSSGGAVENLFLIPFVYLFLFGLILLIVSGEKRFYILYALLIFIIFTTAVFYTVYRLRLPFETLLIIVGSYGICEQIKLIRQVKQKGRVNLNDPS